MNKKSITKNYLYNLTYQIMVLILPLITAPYISRVLGAENIGIYSYTISISAIFILFGTLGITLYGQREIAYLQNDKYKYSITFWEIIMFKTITMAISLLVFYFTLITTNNEYSIYYKILILEIIANAIDISWFFQGMEEFKKTVTRNLIVKIISIISIFIFVKSKEDIYIYFWIYVISILVGNLSLWLYLPKCLTKVKAKDINIFKHLKPTIGLFIPQIAVQVYTLLDKTMLGTIIEEKSEVGFYEQSQKIIKMLLTIITSLGTVMLPRIANTFAIGDKEKVTKYMKKSFNIVFLIAFPLIFGILAVSKLFVPIFFGPGYEKVATLMNVISPIILLIGISNVTGTQYLLPTKRQKEFAISVACGAIVNFIMNSILIYQLGALGASIGTVIAELVVTGVQIFFTRKDLEFKQIAKLCKNYISSSLIMFGICFLIGKLIHNNYASIVLQVGIGSIVYAICLLALKDKFIFEVIDKLKTKINHKTIKERI